MRKLLALLMLSRRKHSQFDLVDSKFREVNTYFHSEAIDARPDDFSGPISFSLHRQTTFGEPVRNARLVTLFAVLLSACVPRKRSNIRTGPFK